jgi:hypothetical protein
MAQEAQTPIKLVTLRIEAAMAAIAATESSEKTWVTHYGANDIHPRHLVYWICVQSDIERDRLRADSILATRFRDLLVEHDYPPEGRSGVLIGFESQETVDRESGGHWWHHWK